MGLHGITKSQLIESYDRNPWHERAKTVVTSAPCHLYLLNQRTFYSSQYAKLAISLRVPGGGGKKKKPAAAPEGGASGTPAAEEEDEYEGGLC